MDGGTCNLQKLFELLDSVDEFKKRTYSQFPFNRFIFISTSYGLDCTYCYA
jgi:hypothetical protein